MREPTSDPPGNSGRGHQRHVFRNAILNVVIKNKRRLTVTRMTWKIDRFATKM